MTRAALNIVAPQVRGWCPGALRPMLSGDGLIVRLRPRGQAPSAGDLIAIATMAEAYGNGLIDLTRRANIQLRGVAESNLPAVWAELDRIGLLDGQPDAEAIRNVLISPLAGADPSELVDARALADELDAALTENSALWTLPAKFAFVIDGGGALPLDGERADIRLRAAGPQSIAIGIDRTNGPHWIGTTTPGEAVAAAVALAERFIALRPNSRARMRDLTDRTADELCASASARLHPLPAAPGERPAHRPLGAITIDGRTIAAGFAAPFGRLDAAMLRRLAESALRIGVAEFRVSPWRSLYALGDTTTAPAMIEAAVDAGLIVDAGEPLLAIDACPGGPACASSMVDTRAAAREMAPMLAELGLRSCHVSGCIKGCARSAAADLTLVGADDCFGVVRYDTPRATPLAFVPPDNLAALRQMLKPA
jgi:precorrin-3B synthase